MKNESPVTGTLKACLWSWRHKPFAEARSSKGGRQVISGQDPSCHAGVLPCRVSSTWWQSGQKTGRGRGMVCVLLKKGHVLFCLKHGKRSILISFPLNCPHEAAYMADLDACPCLMLERGKMTVGFPSTKTFLLLMWGISDSTLYPSFSPIFHQKVSIQRTLDAYKSLPSPWVFSVLAHQTLKRAPDILLMIPSEILLKCHCQVG